ncbi:hypothetical protein V8C44DRAFT_4103 [Trichoderma aethiopicum]
MESCVCLPRTPYSQYEYREARPVRPGFLRRWYLWLICAEQDRHCQVATKAPPYGWTCCHLKDAEDGYCGLKRSDWAGGPCHFAFVPFSHVSLGHASKNKTTATMLLAILAHAALSDEADQHARMGPASPGVQVIMRSKSFGLHKQRPRARILPTCIGQFRPWNQMRIHHQKTVLAPYEGVSGCTHTSLALTSRVYSTVVSIWRAVRGQRNYQERPPTRRSRPSGGTESLLPRPPIRPHSICP